MHRVNITFSDEEWKAVRRYCKNLRPYLRVGTTLKEILLQNVTVSNVTLQNVTTPTPSPARAPYDPKKEEDKKSVKLLPLDASERIIGYLNEMAGGTFRPSAERPRVLLQRLVSNGATEDNIKSVIRKKTIEWKDDAKMVKYLRPSTLFGPKFEEYLGEPDPARQGDMWSRREEQPHERRKREARERGDAG